MKFAPKILTVALLLLLSGCSLPTVDVSATNEPDIIFATGGVPNPAQTTWSTPESTPTFTPAPTEKPEVQEEAPTSTAELCGALDPTLVFRFGQSLMKCPELLALRAQLTEEAGEQYVDAALLDYHERYCTEHGGKQTAEPLPKYDPAEPKIYDKPVDPNRQLEGSTVPDATSLEFDLGAYTPCLSPDEIVEQHK